MAKVNTNLEGYSLQETGKQVEDILQSVNSKADDSTVTALSKTVSQKADKSELPTIDTTLSKTSGNPIANRAVANAIEDISDGTTAIVPRLARGTKYNDYDISEGLDALRDVGYDLVIDGYIFPNLILPSSTQMATNLIENSWLKRGIWDIIQKFANHTLNTYKASSFGAYRVPNDAVYIIENDMDAAFSHFDANDDSEYILSEAIAANHSRICIVMGEPKGGANPSDGSLLVLGEDVLDAYNASLDIPLTYTLSSYGADGSTQGNFIDITLQEDYTRPYDEYPGICFGVDNNNNPMMWIYGDVGHPIKLAGINDIDNISNGTTTITPTLGNNTTYGNIELGTNAMSLNGNTYSGYTSLSDIASDLYTLKTNGIAGVLSAAEKAQLIAEIKQAAIADLGSDVVYAVDTGIEIDDPPEN